MALPASGAISLSQVNVELGLASTTVINMNQATVRTLFGVPSGAISMSNGYGKSAGPTVIGQAFGGGFYAGKIAVGGGGTATHYLIVAPKASGENSSKQWKTTNTSTAGTSSDIDGPTNSANMNNASHPAAQFCEALSIGGYTDWYMPTKNELEVCYYFLKPTTTVNNTVSGFNGYAVSPEPISTNHSSGSPAQTSATAFQTGNAEAFAAAPAGYWSSTGLGAPAAWGQYFYDGNQYGASKSISYYVRAVRRVPI